MVEIGRLCIKIAGRDSGQFCTVVSIIDKNNVVIDGNVRRKKCNLNHLEFLDKILKIKEKATSEEVRKALEKEGIRILKKGQKRERKDKPKRSKAAKGKKRKDKEKQ